MQKPPRLRQGSREFLLLLATVSIVASFIGEVSGLRVISEPQDEKGNELRGVCGSLKNNGFNLRIHTDFIAA